MKPATKVAFWYTAARLAGMFRPRRRVRRPWPEREYAEGISVVIPSRNGKDLLSAQLPGILRDLEGFDAEIIVVDNGSDDGTAGWLHQVWPRVEVQVYADALSFARAVNCGIASSRYSRICLLNNDMIIEPGFFAALVKAFEQVPDLFSATAQILFPPGVRREETGKAVYSQPTPEDFPIRCDEPIPGEDLTYVLYGSGGCTLYDARKLRVLGGIDECFTPVYVEDLDIGYRAWQKNWPSVYVAGAVLEHRHRATSSRYYTEEQLDEILETNYLRFVARAVADPEVFQRLWKQALDRLRLMPDRPAWRNSLRAAWEIALDGGPADHSDFPEALLLALSGGGIAVFPGGAPWGREQAVVAGTKPRPGGVLVMFMDQLAPPAPEILAVCAEVVVVRRSDGPLAFRGALRQTVQKWRPEVVYLEGSEMAGNAGECLPARVITSS